MPTFAETNFLFTLTYAIMTQMRTFTFDRACNGFVGKLTDKQGNSYEIALCDYKKKQEAKAEKQAEAIELWIDTQLDDTLSLAAQQLTDTYNANWRPEGGQPLTWEELRLQLKLQNINAFANAGFELYIGCGQLFGEHLVQVYINGDFSFEEVKVLG